MYSCSICVNRTVGEILAVSLAQGGPAPAFFSPWTYSYLCSGRINQKVLNSDSVADVQLRELIDQVWVLYYVNAGLIRNKHLFSNYSHRFILNMVKRCTSRFSGWVGDWAFNYRPIWWNIELWIYWKCLHSKQGHYCSVCLTLIYFCILKYVTWLPFIKDCIYFVIL